MQVDLPHFDPEAISGAELAALSRSHWIARSDRGFEVLRYRPAIVVLDHPQLEKGATFKRRLDELGITGGPIRAFWDRMLVCNEGEVRERLRVPLAKLFSPAQMNRLRAELRVIIDGVLDEVADVNNVDFMQEIAWKIPSRVYCFLVSAPRSFAPQAARLSDTILAPILTRDMARRQACIDATFELYDLVERNFDARRNSLTDDFTSLMIRQQLDGLLTQDELVLQGVSILQASIENTVHQLGLTFATLLERPERWPSLVERPELIPAAIEETIRLNPRFGTVFRLAANDMVLDGVPIPGGSWVYVSIRSASRDESVFDQADEFSLQRPRTRSIMFGGGPYNCLGQSLARLEISETIHAVMARFPKVRIRGDWQARVTNAVTEVSHLQVELRGS